ncbi:hypothetical protein N9153_02925 [Planctomicrobium sp.]|jgi:hypothetical protein|nr:hypothetical protein [Planctomicrobium sp.]
MLKHLNTWLKNRPIWKITLLVLVPVPLLIAFGIWFSSQRSLNAKLDAIRDQGLPTNVEELNDYYSIPEGVTDSTDLWMAAFDALEKADLDNRGKDLPFLGMVDAPKADEVWDDLPKAKQLIDDLNNELNLIYDAAEAGGQIRYPIVFTGGEFDTLPMTQKSRTVARFLSLAVLVHVRSGDCEAAYQDVKAVLSLSNAMSGEVSIISALIKNAIRASGTKTLEQALSECEWSDAQLLELQELVQSLDLRASIIRAINGERAFMLTSIELLPITVLKTANKQNALDYFEESFATFTSSWEDILKVQKENTNKIAKNAPGSIQLMRSIATTLLAGAHEQFIIANMRIVAHQRCSNAALAAKRYQLKNGTLPQSLEAIPNELFTSGEFSQELLTDPYDSKPLRYKLEGDRLLIYSVGEDQIDDGGDCPQDDSRRGLDIGFWLKKGK